MGKIAENISKDLELAVFERDSFTCQECGKKVPSVVLFVWYKKSPECGGKDEMENLITCCHECLNVQNLTGMKILKREQLEMFFYWKQIVNAYDEDVLRMLVEYINEKIKPFYLSKKGELSVRKELKKNELCDIFDVIDKVYDDCIEYDDNDKITKESAASFMKNIPAYLSMKRKPEVEQRIYYIRGICRKRFSYCNDDVALDLLQEYVQALREYGYSEEALMNDLTTALQSETIKCKNWTQWKSMVEQWTLDVREWIRQKDADDDMVESLSDDDIYVFTTGDCKDVLSRIEILQYLLRGFPGYDPFKSDELERDMCFSAYNFLKEQKDILLNNRKVDSKAVADVIEARRLKYRPSKYFCLGTHDEVNTSELSYNTRFLIYENYYYNIVRDMLSTLDYTDKSYDYPTAVQCINLALQIFMRKIREIDFGEEFTL